MRVDGEGHDVVWGSGGGGRGLTVEGRRRQKLNVATVMTATHAHRLLMAVDNRGPRFTGLKVRASSGESRTFIF